jgi:transposase
MVEIRRVLNTTFPELEGIRKPFSKTMLYFLKKYPSARLIRSARPDSIARALSKTPGSCKLKTTPKDIIKAAKASVGTASVAKELILVGKIETLEHLQKRQKELTKALVECCESVVIKDLEIVTSITGISNTTATSFLAEMGHVSNYASHKKLIAYAGIDPTVYQSGKYEGASRISKRGNRHLRRVIWLMTVNVIRHNPLFKAYYEKKRSEGQPPKKAIFATAHKLIRTIYAMLSQRTHYREVCV